ncbi:MAG: hypothetical protein F4Z39_12055 [Chloroflexi bacterium]|nr:hypothetical protein [Chloroflexota bacterium]
MVLIASSLLLFLLSGLGAAQSLPAAEQPFALQELEDPLHDIVLPTMYAMLEADVSPTLADATLIN